MDVYDTELENADALRRKDARSVEAWIRAAAYAAGGEPDALLPVTRQRHSDDESLSPTREHYERDALALCEPLAVRTCREA